ncbi:heat-inducible transcription repressor HrcA [Clostridia bacterium]|nr:heat-inducible transcription repressor HrcA [Clostridia bacterium]
MELSDRGKEILKAVVNTYIDKCEPVGSKFLAESYGLDLSPASIRNTMNDLERSGLLEQPHTSAGRVPSSLGYRVYVDSLMESYRLTSSEISEISDNMRQKVARLDKIFASASRLISSLTNLMAVSMTSGADKVRIVKIDTVYFDTSNFLIVVVTSLSVVRTKHFKSNIAVNEDVLLRLRSVFNEYLKEADISTVSLPVIIAMEAKMEEYAPLVSPVLKVIYEAVSEVTESEVFIDGAVNLLNLPEYHDIDKAKGLITLLDNKESLLDVVSHSGNKTDNNKVSIFIGEEFKVTESNDSSFIFKKVPLGDTGSLGAIGVIGPRRMDYSKVIAKLEYFSENITNMLKDAASEE